jgi:alpha-amylase
MRRLLAVLLVTGCSGTSPPLVPAARQPAATADWWNGAVVYEVFVRSFRDSGTDGKGDIQGLVQKLDYLNAGAASTGDDLGVDAIWLMPIYPSPSYHGYDVTSYDGVNPEYGSLADMDALIAACHARGIKVILDWVPNHTSSQHPWFVDSASSPASVRRDWYVWSAASPGWTQPWGGSQTTWYLDNGAWYYAVFWSGMPDLNWTNAAVRAEMSAAAGRWLARGVDGFRLDAVRYLVESGAGPGQMDQPDTHRYLQAFSAGVRTAKPDALVLGEAWADAATIATYFHPTVAAPSGDEVLPFDFPLADATVSGVADGSAREIAAALDSAARAYPAGTGDAPFLTNHDQVRLATRLGPDPAKLRLAASILLTLQGTPILYYGEEIGLQNGACPSDECKRTPMAWDDSTTGGFTAGSTPWWPLSPGTGAANVASQTGDPSSLLSRYRRLIRLRKASPALRLGGLARLPTEDAGVLSFLRGDAGETVLVAHNVTPGAATVTVALPGWTGADPLLADPGAALAPGSGESWTLTVPGQGSGIWRLR